MAELKTRGFTVLMASLVAGVVLAITIGVLSLSTREFQISSITKRSSIAFYNADTGIECAFYHDVTKSVSDPVFPEPTGSGSLVPSVFPLPEVHEIRCVKNLRTVTFDGCMEDVVFGVRSCTYSFTIDPDIEVTVTKNLTAVNHWSVFEVHGMSGPVNQRTERIREYTYGNPP